MQKKKSRWHCEIAQIYSVAQKQNETEKERESVCVYACV